MLASMGFLNIVYYLGISREVTRAEYDPAVLPTSLPLIELAEGTRLGPSFCPPVTDQFKEEPCLLSSATLWRSCPRFTDNMYFKFPSVEY